MDRKRRKVDSENRQFQPKWRDMYCFTLPDRTGAVPVCMICQETVALVKSENLKRHYNRKHQLFSEQYPVGSNLRKAEIERLCSSYTKSTQIIKRSVTEQEKCAEASLRVSWVLAKHMKPFTDANIVKECMLAAGDALFENKKDVLDTLHRIPLSASSNTRNIEVLAEENYTTLKRVLTSADCYSLAVDESCDITGIAQLILFVRYLDKSKNHFVEELLTILPLTGTTQGEDLYNAVIKYYEESGLDMKKLSSITTDGAPAMVGSKKGLVQRLIRDPKCNENLISYHCIIHQSVLCCKLNPNLEIVMQEVVKIVNFIRAKSSLSHRQFKSFLEECDA
jgi:hypothetical protein